ncbi:hypothetical protein FHW69_003575 [Luteibacter sp. Sphag1AF]|uniref:catalase family protein n=1 Tax=Luteibacter sp. Sphag1AF TaxID=2587031 RepID=UPI00161F8D4C|nr:catalase family protein [Luteibacter sp. Sphag1AF]MBB3228927.1 hypothetical protein [Luteibacter sp. Sphag1AF]
MPLSLHPAPIRFDESLEVIEPDEAQTAQSLIDTLTGINETTLRHEGHANRAVHAKSHGLLTGELIVPGDLPPELAQGLFATPGHYPLVMRLSTVPGDILDDSVSTPRGMAIKIFDVKGPRLPGCEGDSTQDFVMVNGPTFSAPDAKKFLSSLKLVAATTDKAEGAKKAISAVLRGAEKVIEAFGGKSSTLLALGGQPETHILGDTFFSQVPLRFGDYVVKFSVAPASPNLVRLTDLPLDLHDRPNGIREAVIEHFAREGGEWEVRVQFCTDPEAMPIEDASVSWPQERSPYIEVARIVVPAQPAWNEARRASIDDGLSFNPWHALAAHRPLGSVMRARRVAYKAMAAFRARHNGTAPCEPKSIDDLNL